jgi:hypothetical protein
MAAVPKSALRQVQMKTDGNPRESFDGFKKENSRVYGHCVCMAQNSYGGRTVV